MVELGWVATLHGTCGMIAAVYSLLALGRTVEINEAEWSREVAIKRERDRDMLD